MNFVREYHTASILTNGQVLITGGYNSVNGYLNSAELYDPSTGNWTITANMNFAREYHTASILANGTVFSYWWME